MPFFGDDSSAILSKVFISGYVVGYDPRSFSVALRSFSIGRPFVSRDAL